MPINLRQAIARLSLLLLVGATLLALFRPMVDYDSNWYHFPFSQVLLHINGKTASDLTPFVYDRFQGFPKFAEAAQGFFWRITGSRNLVTLPHVILFGLYLWMVRRYLLLPVQLLVLAIFACPMILIHYLSTLVDFFSSLCVALAFFSGVRAVWQLSRPDPRVAATDGLIAAIAAVMACNSKYQYLLSTFLLLAVLFIQVVFSRRIPSGIKLRAAAFTAIVAVACSIVPVTNLAHLHNPFYPVQVNVSHHVVFSGPEPMDDASPNYSPSFLNLPPIRFFLSASEIDWSIRGIPTGYSDNSAAGDSPARFSPARTGGWGGLYFLLQIAVLGLALLNYQRVRDTYLGVCLMTAVVLLVGTCFLPQSFMLRYYLHVPLILIPIALKLCLVNRPTLKCVQVFLVVLLAFNLCYFHLGLGTGVPAHHRDLTAAAGPK